MKKMRRLVCLGMLFLTGCSAARNVPAEESSVSGEEYVSAGEAQSVQEPVEDEDSISSSSQTGAGNTVDENGSGRIYTEEEKNSILAEFLDWASYRAEIGGMVVSDYYLGHGASGAGDWYADTVNGEMQIQDSGQGIPGYEGFPLHALGGVVFYTSQEERYGYDERPWQETIAAGFSDLADPDMPMTRYLLADDGLVYRLSERESPLRCDSTPFRSGMSVRSNTEYPK